MGRFITIALLLVLTAGCSQPGPPVGSWPANLEWARVYYRAVPNLEPAGRARVYPNFCLVEVRESLVENGFMNHVPVVAHEVGHCFDYFSLDFDHNGFEDEGCHFGDYYCAPEEGYAEAFALAYLEACGRNPYPLGWGEVGEPCVVPAPRSVTPASL